jgi:FKBP-type peptidyl-prolyl cis-trans isomerase FkpA
MLRRFLPVILVGALASSFSCGGSSTTPAPLNVPYSVTDLIVGTGATVASGMAVQFSYIVYQYSTTAADHKGPEITDSNISGPFVAQLGQNPPQMIAALEQGLIGMKVSGRRQIVAPPDLAYGATGAPQNGIPPNATLLFIIDLLQAQAVTSAKQPTMLRVPLSPQ